LSLLFRVLHSIVSLSLSLSHFYIDDPERNWNFRNNLGDRARPLRLSRRGAMFIFREVLTARARRCVRRVLVYPLYVCACRGTRFSKSVDDVGIRSGRERRAREATGGGQN